MTIKNITKTTTNVTAQPHHHICKTHPSRTQPTQVSSAVPPSSGPCATMYCVWVMFMLGLGWVGLGWFVDWLDELDLGRCSYRRTFCLNFLGFFSRNLLHFQCFLLFFFPIIGMRSVPNILPSVKISKLWKCYLFLGKKIEKNLEKNLFDKNGPYCLELLLVWIN